MAYKPVKNTNPLIEAAIKENDRHIVDAMNYVVQAASMADKSSMDAITAQKMDYLKLREQQMRMEAMKPPAPVTLGVDEARQLGLLRKELAEVNEPNPTTNAATNSEEAFQREYLNIPIDVGEASKSMKEFLNGRSVEAEAEPIKGQSYDVLIEDDPAEPIAPMTPERKAQMMEWFNKTILPPLSGDQVIMDEVQIPKPKPEPIDRGDSVFGKRSIEAMGESE